LIHFIFETIEGEMFRNFTDCHDLNDSGLPRFNVSPLMLELLYIKNENIEFNFSSDIPEGHYIIPTSVGHSPRYWTGNNKYSDWKSIFYYLNERYYQDLKNGKAFLLLDQSHEGYHCDWLFEWFHTECSNYQISPSQIIYVTGDLTSNKKYNTWADYKKLNKRLKIVPYAHFELAISRIAREKSNSLTSKNHMDYKRKNSSSTRTFNCLQKRPRNHRMWLFLKLFENNLLQHGFNSMNYFPQRQSYLEGSTIAADDYAKIVELLPQVPPNDNDENLSEFSSQDCGKYIQRLNEDIMIRSWITIVSESSFGDSENTCFLSEKTFKPIACAHPFIIFGNKYSLKKLRTLGYRTFHPFIDETYDELDTWQRLDAIILQIKKLTSMSYKQKKRFYKNIAPILSYNQRLLLKRCNATPEFILEKFRLIDKKDNNV
jgi:hypothetical protein